MKFEVIKDIPKGWETSAKKGDILSLGLWQGEQTLFNKKLAVCDADSYYATNHCKQI